MKNLAVLFGGQSNEHEVSVNSAINIINLIDKSKWNIIKIGVTKEGRWLYVKDFEDIKNGSWKNSSSSAEISPDAVKQCVKITDEAGKSEEIHLDVVIPVFHGKYGEDGTVQGLLEMAHIPYVGCGILASAASMDKFYTKIIVNNENIRQARFVGVTSYDMKDLDETVLRIEKELEYPVFIKPSKAGSSCGVTKAHTREELIGGLKKAYEVDSKILVEEFIKGHEVECAVFSSGNEIKVSRIGEILAAAEFYDYDAKYNNPDSKTVTDPDIDVKIVEEIRDKAGRIFKALDCYGLSRVDFFINDKNEVIFNEINTFPGFTNISMYPMLFEAYGVSKPQLIEDLIESAFNRMPY